ncbi:response regulator [Caldibacillus lycopersici]|uniref:Response regulator n=1 Tax=Perspicuibacillus lycopersici TaxID=1325689 RepID=A0AAE3ITP9_9BACI|nr:response regulator [Perspicuibacillus lycopersici]MCU9612584.1 response regulator [Perspicuibacillus lycopersici]
MNLLIVDDDRYVIASLEKKMDWHGLGFEQVYTANNIRQAMEIFHKHQVDILISDIEMPHGSGLELLAWIRSEGYNVQAILLTNFADFNYAQKAIELQSFEYYLKPIEFDKLEFIIKKAIKKATISQRNESITSSYTQRNKEKLVEHFWFSYVTYNRCFTRAELQEHLQMNCIDYSLNDCFFPILLNFYPYQLIDNKKIISIFDAKPIDSQLVTIIKETVESHPLKLDGFLKLRTKKEEYLAIFKVVDSKIELTASDLRKLSKHLINPLTIKLQCDVQLCVDSIGKLEDIPQMVQKLQAMHEESINYRNNVFSLQTYKKSEATYVIPNLQLLEEYLDNGANIDFINYCKQYITSLVEKNALNHTVLSSFRLDITQLIYTQLKKKEILAHKLFHGEVDDFLLQQSSRSIEDLITYITYLVDVSIDYMAFTNSKKSVVKTICDYIDQNYQENITRVELAKIVYLSPDYIARIFKKEKGISLFNYIIKKRIDIAKELLVNTNLPIHLISDKVGYGNYSYFTKLFKQETNCTPLDYRKKHGICSEIDV